MGNLLSENVIVPVALFAMVVLVVWFGHMSKRARIQQQAEIRKRLLDKFSSGRELTEFLATPQGQSFLQDHEAGEASGSPKARIVRLVVVGVIFAVLGGAFFVLTYLGRGFIYPAAIITALGVGMIVAAVISYFLYKKWSMI